MIGWYLGTCGGRFDLRGANVPGVRPRIHPRHRLPLIAALVACLTAAVVDAPSAQAATRTDVTHAAAAYARSQGYHIGIAVIDTTTGAYYGSGDYFGLFATESVAKVFIATRLLAEGEM